MLLAQVSQERGLTINMDRLPDFQVTQRILMTGFELALMFWKSGLKIHALETF